ncbi:peptidoglycan bridge formation glycyltransferase FemA/FemB family protein [Aerococcus urinaeequi]|uniref:peptidoglycan bridge formation glycyltransferase FemA/FemB family protein n=1 Tax=Aerococcus urinaeequi TaxID=51665 RepID=UPI003D6B7D1F
MQDIYFEPNYGKLYEKMENGISECFEYSNEHGSITNLFIKREIPIILDSEEKYYDITTPYGYGGPIINNVVKGKEAELVNGYKKAFMEFCLANNIVSEFIRFHPVIGNEIPFKVVYDVQYLRKTVGTNLKEFEEPFQEEFSKSARKNVRRSLREGVSYEIIENPDSIDGFLEIYYSTMDRNEADDYYYFDEEYFKKCLELFPENILIVKSLYEEKTIAMGFYFIYDKYIHTHLSGTLSEYLNLSPAYILRYALTEWGKENGYHLIHHGGATTNDENDSLFRFKKRFGQNTEFDFSIGRRIWNQEIYDKLCKEVNADKNIDFFPAYRV